MTLLKRMLNVKTHEHSYHFELIKQYSGTSGTTNLLYYIIGYMFLPIYRSSSGLLLQASPLNAMNDGIPSC